MRHGIINYEKRGIEMDKNSKEFKNLIYDLANGSLDLEHFLWQRVNMWKMNMRKENCAAGFIQKCVMPMKEFVSDLGSRIKRIEMWKLS